MLGIYFMCHQSASLSCSNTTDKKYDSPKTNLYSYKLISVNTLYYYKVSAKYCIPAHDTMMHCVSQYLVDMIVHELWYNFCVCG